MAVLGTLRVGDVPVTIQVTRGFLCPYKHTMPGLTCTHEATLYMIITAGYCHKGIFHNETQSTIVHRSQLECDVSAVALQTQCRLH